MTKTNLTVAEYLTKAIELSGRTQREIAREVGYPKPNVISMMKQGQTKVPIEKAPLFAKACGVDPAFFLRLVLQEYFPDAWAAIFKTFGETLTANEMAMVEAYRETAPSDEIEVDFVVASRVKDALKGPKT